MLLHHFQQIVRVPELRSRVLITLILILIFRLRCVIPVPGIDIGVVQTYLQSQDGVLGIVEYLDYFSGSAFSQFSIFMLSVSPYIAAGIVLQMLQFAFPALKKRFQQEGGRKKQQYYTRLASIVMTIVQSTAMTFYAAGIPDAVITGRGIFTILTVLSVAVGTAYPRHSLLTPKKTKHLMR